MACCRHVSLASRKRRSISRLGVVMGIALVDRQPENGKVYFQAALWIKRV